LFTIEVIYDTNGEEAPGDPAEPTISLHALTGIQPWSKRTMQLRVSINDTVLLVLLDSGSTHNFVDTEAAARVGIPLQGRLGIRNAVANGDHVDSSGCCHGLVVQMRRSP
jgi:hypothetical protein